VEAQRATIEDTVRELAAIDRPSASPGEREAAERIAARLTALGAAARLEEERAHGGYWWPIGLLNGGAALAALRAPRRLAALTAAAAAAAVWDDLSGGRLWFRRRLLPSRPTWNVVAEAGDREASRTVVLVAHHDAAHSGLIFHPALPSFARERFGSLVDRSDRHLPVLFGVWLGPVLIGAGATLRSRRLLRLGTLFALGASAVMANIGTAPVVEGANDNLSSVGVLVAVAAALRERPVSGVRVLLVSTGSEEAFMEGMQAFGRRHFAALDPAATDFLCLECVGSPDLVVLEGEGMLRMRDYPQESRDELAAAAADAGVPVRRGLRTVAATDGLISLRAGYPTATLGGVDPYTMFPSQYHWESDTTDNVSWESVERAAAVVERFVRRRAG
jgi:hypothetical protein